MKPDLDPPDRRASPRIWVNEVAQFEVRGQRVVGLLTMINRAGMFVTTRHVVTAGARLDLEFDLPETGQFLRVNGEVVSTNGPGAYDGRKPMGMGIRFLSMDAATRALIHDFLGRVALG